MLFKLNKTKALETLLFVCNRLEVADKHKVSKILYHADKAHLENYGRMITGDKYVKMPHGPVPSWIYDVIKENEKNPQVIQVDGYNLKPLREAKKEELSESDIACLTDSIKLWGTNLGIGKNEQEIYQEAVFKNIS